MNETTYQLAGAFQQQNQGRTLDLDTRYSQSPSTPYDTEWIIARDNFITLKGFYFSIRAVEFPNAVYNVNEFYDTLIIQENGSGFIVLTLEHKNYDADQLITEIQQQLLNEGATLTYTITFDEQTQKFTFSVPLPNYFQFFDNEQGILSLIGFDESNLKVGASQVSDYQIRLGGTQHIYIVSNIVNENYSVNGVSKLLAVIPVTVPFGEITYWQASTIREFFVPAHGVDELSIKVYDENRNLWKLDKSQFLRLELYLRPINFDEATHLPIIIQDEAD